jgi:hypothetical protein
MWADWASQLSDVIPLSQVELKAQEVEAITRLLRNTDEGATVDAFEGFRSLDRSVVLRQHHLGRVCGRDRPRSLRGATW